MNTSVRFQGIHLIYAPTRKRVLDKAHEIDKTAQLAIISTQPASYVNPKNHSHVNGILGRVLTDDDAAAVLKDFGVQISDPSSKTEKETLATQWFDSWSKDKDYASKLNQYDQAVAAYTRYQQVLNKTPIESHFIPRRKTAPKEMVRMPREVLEHTLKSLQTPLVQRTPILFENTLKTLWDSLGKKSGK